MGILNVTPDSFSDGGKYQDFAAAIERALAMFVEGAAIVDIGGESTRPGRRPPISPAEEIDRILPVIEGVLAASPRAILSVDTWKAETAAAALRAGVEIVNDVSGLLWDAGMAALCRDEGCGTVIMHTRGRPEDWSRQPPLPDCQALRLVAGELAQRLHFALGSGIATQAIVLDPGLGFGKSGDNNYRLIARLGELRELGQPLLAGASRKSFLGRTLAHLRPGGELSGASRENVSLAAATAAILAGADLVRVHDVRATVEAAAVADEILASAETSEAED